MTNNTAIPHDAAMYLATMTAEVLHMSDFSTAETINVAADGVPELLLPAALYLNDVMVYAEHLLRAEHQLNLWHFSGGVFAYEIVEPFAQDIYTALVSGTDAYALKLSDVLYPHLCEHTSYWYVHAKGYPELLRCLSMALHQVRQRSLVP